MLGLLTMSGNCRLRFSGPNGSHVSDGTVYNTVEQSFAPPLRASRQLNYDTCHPLAATLLDHLRHLEKSSRHLHPRRTPQPDAPPSSHSTTDDSERPSHVNLGPAIQNPR